MINDIATTVSISVSVVPNKFKKNRAYCDWSNCNFGCYNRIKEYRGWNNRIYQKEVDATEISEKAIKTTEKLLTNRIRIKNRLKELNSVVAIKIRWWQTPSIVDNWFYGCYKHIWSNKFCECTDHWRAIVKHSCPNIWYNILYAAKSMWKLGR